MPAPWLGWLFLAVAASWVGLAGSSVRRAMSRLETEEPDEEDYRTVSLLRRLQDDPVDLGLRLRFSRLAATSLIPLAFGAWWGRLGWEAALVAIAGGWWLGSVADAAGGSARARGVVRFPGGRGIGVWSRLTGVPARLARPLLRLRPAATAASEGEGYVLAESQASLTPTGARLSREERRLLRRLLASNAILVSDIMTRWERVHALPAGMSVDGAVTRIKQWGRSRIPVLEGERVTGLVTVKDLLVRAGNGRAPAALHDLARPVHFVREGTTVRGLLEEFKLARAHLAVVVDRLGRPVGLATVEDILEEIVGELYDEREAPGGAA